MSVTNKHKALSIGYIPHEGSIFIEKWKSVKIASPKLEFHNSIKSELSPEKYLNLVNFKCSDPRKTLTNHFIAGQAEQYK